MRKYHDLLHYWMNRAILQLSTQSNRNERVHYRLMWLDTSERTNIKYGNLPSL